MTCEMREKPSLPALRFNNRYLLDWMRRANRAGFRALDFGCGNGALVFTARQAGIDAYGAETYYDGARPQDLELVRAFDPETTYVRTIDDGRLPFPDEWFDLVVANQVFEHIHDLDAAAREFARVLKPGGSLLSIFPTSGVIREGHLGVPLIHHLPKGIVRRTYYRLARRMSRRARAIPWGETNAAAVDRAIWFLDNHTCYRTLRQVKRVFRPAFDLQFVDADWLACRLPRWGGIFRRPVARQAAAVLARLAAGTALLATKRRPTAETGVAVEPAIAGANGGYGG